MTRHVWAWLLRWLQRRCPHDNRWVIADVTEGQRGVTQVRWCRACGAVAFTYRGMGTLMPPEPTWCVRKRGAP